MSSGPSTLTPSGSHRAPAPASDSDAAPDAPQPGRLAAFLTGRRSAWAVVLLFAVLALAAMGVLRGTGPVSGMDALPAGSESSRAQAVADRVADARYQPVFAVVTRADGGQLTAQDTEAAAALRGRLADASGRDAMRPMPSEDGKATLVITTIDTAGADAQIDDRVAKIRESAHRDVPSDLRVSVTGGPAVGSDIRGAFAGADFTLLAVTIAIVAVLLLLTYRSPVLWLVPLTVVALADGVAGRLTDTLGEQFSLSFDAGVISVLVFGAGTNYALLLISRYREELHRHDGHRAALAHAWRETAPAVLASNLTVVLALLTLLAAVMPATRGLGIAAAAGLLVALFSVLFPLTSLLAIVGRRVFWPFIPRPRVEGADGISGSVRSAVQGTGAARDDAVQSAARDDAERGPFAAVARAVTNRPLIAVLGSLVLLGVLASGLAGTRVGLAQDEQFASANESSAGFAAMSQHYGAGESAPHLIAVPDAQADAVTSAAEMVPGIVRVTPSGSTDDGWTTLSATGTAEPESPQAFTEVKELRAAIHEVAPTSLVGGTSAKSLDVRTDSFRDLAVVAPLILLVVLVVLAGLLRAAVAPVILLATNVLSAVAAIGLGLWVGESLFDIPALDVTVPLIAFLFLVALGVDYTIFLAHRARSEAAVHGTKLGMVRAVGSTGVVITSAGIVLAAVFAALGVLPLVVLFQLGLIVGLGVLLDTVLVRTVLVPALFALVGDRMWWPSRPHAVAPAA